MVCSSVTLLHHEHAPTEGRPEEFRAVFERSRAEFRRRWRERLEASYTRELAWQSILNVPTGYAMSSRALLRVLDERGVRVTYRYVYGRGSPMPLDEPRDARDYRLNVIDAFLSLTTFRQRLRRFPSLRFRSTASRISYSAGGIFPIGSRIRRLNQSIHSRVANSTCSA